MAPDSQSCVGHPRVSALMSSLCLLSIKRIRSGHWACTEHYCSHLVKSDNEISWSTKFNSTFSFLKVPTSVRGGIILLPQGWQVSIIHVVNSVWKRWYVQLCSVHMRSLSEELHLAWGDVTFSDFWHLSWAINLAQDHKWSIPMASLLRSKVWLQHIKISAHLHVIEAQERHDKSTKKETEW